MPTHIAYYQSLDIPRVVRALCYRFKGQPIIYGIRCIATGMVYVGCTFVPQDRFYQHLITGSSSNLALQEAIAKYGLRKFTAVVFAVVEFPDGLPHGERKSYLLEQEARYIAMFPPAQLYNK